MKKQMKAKRIRNRDINDPPGSFRFCLVPSCNSQGKEMYAGFCGRHRHRCQYCGMNRQDRADLETLRARLAEMEAELKGAHVVLGDAGIPRSSTEEDDSMRLIGLSARISMLRSRFEEQLALARRELAEAKEQADV